MSEAMKAAFDKMRHDEINFHILLGNNPLDYALTVFSRGYQAALSQPTTDQHLANFIDPTDYLREVSGIAGAHRQLLNNWVSDAQKGVRSVMPLASVAAQPT